MTSKENKDTATQLAKRVEKSKDIDIQFQTKQTFVIFDESKNIKYYGKLSDNKTEDECSCPSWTYGMKFDEATAENKSKGESRYVAENGFNFQCKHIIGARTIRYGEKAE